MSVVFISDRSTHGHLVHARQSVARVVLFHRLSAVRLARSQVHALQEATGTEDFDDRPQLRSCRLLGVHVHRGNKHRG